MKNPSTIVCTFLNAKYIEALYNDKDKIFYIKKKLWMKIEFNKIGIPKDCLPDCLKNYRTN